MDKRAEVAFVLALFAFSLADVTSPIAASVCAIDHSSSAFSLGFAVVSSFSRSIFIDWLNFSSDCLGIYRLSLLLIVRQKSAARAWKQPLAFPPGD